LLGNFRLGAAFGFEFLGNRSADLANLLGGQVAASDIAANDERLLPGVRSVAGAFHNLHRCRSIEGVPVMTVENLVSFGKQDRIVDATFSFDSRS
jgi:hypothetical protein